MEELKNNTTSYDKGIVLLKNALKKYEDGDIEGGDRDRNLANELLDETNNEQLDDVALYGENRNFGIIFNVITENVKNAYRTNENLKEIGKVLNFLRKSKLLREQYNIYSLLEETQINNDVEHYVNEATELLPTFNKKEIINENIKLIKLIRENNLNELIEINDDKMKFYEAIEFILLNKKKISNIDSFKTNKNIIKEYIEKYNKTTELDESNISNEKEDITESEKNLLKELNEGNKEEIFNRYKNETMKMISEEIVSAKNTDEKIDWNNTMTKVLMKQYNENRILEDICDFVKIQDVINE